MRKENLSLTRESGLIGKTDILLDYEKQYDGLEGSKEQLAELKTRYRELQQQTQGYKERVKQLRSQEPDLFVVDLPVIGSKASKP